MTSPRTLGSPDRLLALANRIAILQFHELPAHVLTVAKQSMLDTIGVAISGARTPMAASVRAALGAESERGAAVVWGTSARTSPLDAALANGAAAHVLDFDDFAPSSGMHPGVVLLPALLAVGQEADISGARALAAYVAGYELQERIGIALQPSHYARGFHTTANVGTFGATAAACHALGGDGSTLRSALNLAATQAAGLKAVFGTIGKPLHAGRAASAGLLAAKLATLGNAVPGDAVFGRDGFIDSHSDARGPGARLVPFGDPWFITDTVFKTMASCLGTHAAAVAIMQLQRAEGFRIEDVEQLSITIPPAALGVCTIPWPSTGLEGKFSLAYVSAVVMTDRAVREYVFSDEAIKNPQRLRLRDRVTLVVDEKLGSLESAVEVKLDDGRTDVANANSGSRTWAQDPAEQWPLLIDKFTTLVEPVMGGANTDALVSLIQDIDHVDRVGCLVDALRLA
jgi:2-methylcitrate dehydratase PrpD